MNKNQIKNHLIKKMRYLEKIIIDKNEFIRVRKEILGYLTMNLSKENKNDIYIVIDMDIEKQIFTVRIRKDYESENESESIFNAHTYFCEPDSDEESFI